LFLTGWQGTFGMNGGKARSKEDLIADIESALRELRRESRERLKVETALRRSEEEHRSLIDNLNVGVYRNTPDLNGRFLKANPAIANIFGYESVRGFMQVPVSDLYLNPEDRKRFISEVIAKGHVRGKDLRLKKKDGTPFWASCTATAKYDADGRIRWIDGIIEDITQRRQAEQALRENEFKFRSLFDLSPQPIALTEFKTLIIREINDRFCRLFRLEPEFIIGRTPVELDLLSKEQREDLLRRLQDHGEIQGLEMDFVPRAGSEIHTLMFSKLVSIKDETFILSIFHDVTEKKRLEAQIQQAQRIEAIGTLAGGLAHDFNNLLMAIQGNVSLLRIKYKEDAELCSRLEAIEEYIENGSDLTRQLLGFARGGKCEVRPLDINELIVKSAKMFGRTRKEINISHRLAEDIWSVEADSGQLEQVLLNLYLNAWQAMPGGGNLYLGSENVVLDASFVRAYESKPGQYVKISIADTGSGMDDETLQRIFDPFFTTKELGLGTGLGLASAYGIIKNHGGLINVCSRNREGTVFEIYLPASPEKKTMGKTRLKDEEIAALPRGAETVLLVDDEMIVAKVAEDMLKDLGYEVLVARSGREALSLVSGSRTEIDIVILDLIMPDMNGSRTFDYLKEIAPDVKVLLSSGYSIDSQAAAILDRGGNGFIQKPYNIAQLSRKLREILDARQTESPDRTPID
jgi:PAS domain S-box-containing protein